MSLSSLLWLIKIISGLLLLPLVLIHLSNIHFSLSTIPTKELMILILILASLHILAGLRDILIEANFSKSTSLVVTLLICLLILFPVAKENRNSLRDYVNSTAIEGDSCIENPDRILYSHKLLLKAWREEAIRKEERFIVVNGYTYKKSFETCYSCHNYSYFCLECHKRIGIDPECFQCHDPRFLYFVKEKSNTKEV